MKRLFIILLVLSLGLLAVAQSAEAANPFSDQEEDWSVQLVNPRENNTSIVILGKTDVKLDEAGITTVIEKSSGTVWPMSPGSPNVAYLTGEDSVIASISLPNIFYDEDFKIMFKYGGHESPQIDLCYYAASTVLSSICTNPFEQSGEDNELIELSDDEVKLLAKLVRVKPLFDLNAVRLYVKQSIGNPLNVSYQMKTANQNTLLVEFDPGPSLLNRTYFFEFGEYKSPDFVLQGMALIMTLRPMEYQAFLGEEGTIEESGSIEESGNETTVATGDSSDLPEASTKASGHCSLVTDVTFTGMGMLTLLLVAMVLPLAVVRIRRKKH